MSYTTERLQSDALHVAGHTNSYWPGCSVGAWWKHDALLTEEQATGISSQGHTGKAEEPSGGPPCSTNHSTQQDTLRAYLPLLSVFTSTKTNLLCEFIMPFLSSANISWAQRDTSMLPPHTHTSRILQLTQGLEDNALQNDQVLGLLQVSLRSRGQAGYLRKKEAETPPTGIFPPDGHPVFALGAMAHHLTTPPL